MQVKWLVPVLVGASLLTACGDSPTATSTTAVNLSSTAYQTLPPTESTLPPTSVPADGAGTPGEVTTDVTEYEVAAGDVPFNVATRFGVTLDALNLANVDTPNYSSFYVGLKIKIPAGATIPTATTPPTSVPGSGTTVAPVTTIAPDSNGCTPGTYVIVEGDLPGTVAKNFNVTLDQLNAANANTKGYSNFIVGVTIVIPCS